MLAEGGSLVVDTGMHTGRSPQDRYVVREPESEDRIAWGDVNMPIPEPTFESLREAVLALAKDGIEISRFKGLGEMNPAQLWETTMDPRTRTLQQVTMDDAQASDELFTLLMGDRVEPRRDFIETNAREVKSLDV